MARRWLLTVIVASVLLAAAIVAARAIRDDPASTTADRGALTTTSGTPTTSTSAPTSTSTSTPASASAPVPTTNATTATTGPPGPCGNDTAAIRAVIDAGVANAAANADIATCRLAASDPTWASVQLTAKPGAPFNPTTVIVHRVAGAWVIVATGGANAGCGQAPQQVIVDLGQFCAGTGGRGA